MDNGAVLSAVIILSGRVMMKLSEYFETAKGRGVLATSDRDGLVDAALYSRPHFFDEETIAFIMTDRLTHKNVQENPHAAYLFVEAGEHAAGKRLYLTKLREESDPEIIEQVRTRKSYAVPEDDQKRSKFLVFFHIDKVLPLVGDKG
jgi:hypothetical protein